jgi:dTDP-glucose pyrophosphorylase
MPVELDDVVVAPDDSLLTVLKCIDASGLEAAMVCAGDRRLTAVVTDGDCRRAIIAGRSLETPIREIANTSFTSVGPELRRDEVIKLLLERGFNVLPVVDHGRLVDLHTLHVALAANRCDSWAVVMAGGFGTRLGDLTKGVPKPMLPVGDRPILQHIVEHLVGHGIRRVFLSINYLGSQIQEWFGDGSAFHCQIDYLTETTPLGSGGALGLLPERPTAPLVVMNGDLLTRISISRLLAFHRAGDFLATMAVRDHVVTVPFGVAEIKGSTVDRMVEKPKLNYKINAGIYALDPSLLDAIPANEPYPITELFEGVMRSGRKVGAYHMQEPWVDIGLPDEFQRVQPQ